MNIMQHDLVIYFVNLTTRTRTVRVRPFLASNLQYRQKKENCEDIHQSVVFVKPSIIIFANTDRSLMSAFQVLGVKALILSPQQ